MGIQAFQACRGRPVLPVPLAHRALQALLVALGPRVLEPLARKDPLALVVAAVVVAN
jgi:hypothetical protein